jgi:hypothetical protein
LRRLELEYHKPNVIPRKLDEAKQKAFIASYEKPMNSLGEDEPVLFADAVHPAHAARPVGCRAPRQGFLREKVPRNWADLCDSVTDNFRVISSEDFRLMA